MPETASQLVKRETGTIYFVYHYNKQASAEAGSNRLNLFFDDQWHQVRRIHCDVPTHTEDRPVFPQCVVAGYANQIVLIPDGDSFTAHIQ